MSDKIPILQYEIFLQKGKESILEKYFGSSDWVKTSDKSVFCRKRTSTYVRVHMENGKAFVDIWEEGGFGIILPNTGRYIGILGKLVFENIVNDFTGYLDTNGIAYSAGTTCVKGKSQFLYILVVIVIPAVIAVLLFFL